jgi:hypothetical protein
MFDRRPETSSDCFLNIKLCLYPVRGICNFLNKENIFVRRHKLLRKRMDAPS